MSFDIRFNSSAVARRLATTEKQVRYAGVVTANELAKKVRDAETEAMPQVLDNPTPFTMRAFAVGYAKKSSPQAEVFAKQTQAKYLEPVETGGEQVLGQGRSIRLPVDIRTNRYGNIPKNAIARRVGSGRSVPGKRGFFIGKVKGVVGLWQRIPANKKRGWKPGVKLLVEFTRPKEVRATLDFQKRGKLVVSRNAPRVFADALKKALASAK